MVYVQDHGEFSDEPLPSPDQVRSRIGNWLDRVNRLYDLVVSWLPADGYTVNRSMRQPIREPMMKLTGVDGYSAPILVIRAPQPDRVVSFTPNGLWVLGTNGRLHLSGPLPGMRTYLVDRGTDEAPEWRIYPHRDTRKSVPFNRSEFLTLLGTAR